MKTFIRPALLLVLCTLVFSGAALADDIHVIFDPQPATIGDFNLITTPGVDYEVSWVSCSSAGIPAGFSTDDACLAFLNETGGNINALNFSFVVNQALVGQTLDCSNLSGDPHLTSNSCGSVGGAFTLGETVSASFFGGDPIPNLEAFFIDGVSLANAPTVGIEVPEPTSLTLLASGMGLLGLCLAFAKR